MAKEITVKSNSDSTSANVKTKKERDNNMSEQTTKTENNVKENKQKARKPWYKNSFISAILGIGVALVIVSIAYSTAVILYGTTGVVSRVMVAPQAVFLLVLLGAACTKLFK